MMGRAQLSDSILNRKNPLGSSRLAKLRKIFEEGKSLQLQFPAEDPGFRYLKGTLVSEGNEESITSEAPTGRRRGYIPSADPGAKLPHMNIRLLSSNSSKEIYSTLDQISVNEIEFLLIIAPLKESYNLAKSAFKVAEELNIALKVCVLWPEEQITDIFNQSAAALQPWNNFLDVVEVKNTPNSLSSWWDICQMTEKGAILVRPDDNIAWRTKSVTSVNSGFEFKKMFQTVIGIKP